MDAFQLSLGLSFQMVHVGYLSSLLKPFRPVSRLNKPSFITACDEIVMKLTHNFGKIS